MSSSSSSFSCCSGSFAGRVDEDDGSVGGEGEEARRVVVVRDCVVVDVVDIVAAEFDALACLMGWMWAAKASRQRIMRWSWTESTPCMRFDIRQCCMRRGREVHLVSQVWTFSWSWRVRRLFTVLAADVKQWQQRLRYQGTNRVRD